jgi:hypothetical protein
MNGKGTSVLSRDGKEKGLATGGLRVCQMEGCGKLRMGVRWPDGRLTWPCMGGMTLQKGKWRIN